MTKESLPTPAVMMAYAIDEASRGNTDQARLWLDIARELRQGAEAAACRPLPLAEPDLFNELRPTEAEFFKPVLPDLSTQIAEGMLRAQVYPDLLREIPDPETRVLDFGQRHEDGPVTRSAEHVMQDELGGEQPKAGQRETCRCGEQIEWTSLAGVADPAWRHTLTQQGVCPKAVGSPGKTAHTFATPSPNP